MNTDKQNVSDCLKTDRQKSAEVIRNLVPYVTALWSSNTGTTVEIENMLRECRASITTLSPHEITAYLRASFSVSHKLVEWEPTRKAAYTELSSRLGEDAAKRIMVGMLNRSEGK